MKTIETFTDRYGWYICLAAILMGGTVIVYIIMHTAAIEAGPSPIARPEQLLSSFFPVGAGGPLQTGTLRPADQPLNNV
ncbi:MAG: hypothetical protein JNL13_08435 [Chitinophagaceae bacterium]|nr:hypothetical protein [Chitinophagaceae bacterium]